MGKPLRALIVEDSEDDALLLELTLGQGGYEVSSERVWTASGMRAALIAGGWDIIFCDHDMPAFDAPGALCLLRESGLDLPLIIVSGTMGEDLAVEALQQGADDYLVKQNLRRLVPAVERSLGEAENRRRRRAAERTNRLIMDNSVDVICVTDALGRIVNVSAAVEETWGYEPSEMAGRRLAEFLHPDELTAASEASARLHSGTVLRNYETRLLRKDGSYARVLWSAAWSPGDGLCLSAGRDVTEQRQTVAALEASEERFRTAVENAPAGIIVQTRANFAYLNRHAVALFGADSPERLLGTPVIERVRPDSRSSVRARIRSLNEERRAVPRVEEGWLRLDGSEFDAEVSAVPFDFQGEQGALIFITDISERKRLTEQFNQAQKMEAIGQLSGGIAHDFNNILTVILGHVGLLETSTALDDTLRPSVAEIGQAAVRASNLTRQLLLFSRRQTPQLRTLELSELVRSTTRMLGRILGEDIHLRLDCHGGQLLLSADAGMLDQILLNLAVNARDAMPRGGNLLIRTSAVDLDEAQAARQARARPGSFACLSFSDTGSGIGPDVLPHIFEPFFTTKPVGKGTGLGLATVFGIVEQHRGWVSVETRPGEGTTFHIFLPRLAHSAMPAAGIDASAPAPRGSETILVVEDEAALRALVTAMLARHGYRVITAGSGRAALDLWRSQGDKVDLLLTDIVLPGGMSGIELAQHLLEDRPLLKVVFSSGYSPELSSGGLPLGPGRKFLPKPYTPATLVATVRACLDSD